MASQKNPNRPKLPMTEQQKKNLRPPWKPGESGNPNKIRKNPLSDRLRDRIEQKLKESEEGEKVRKVLNLPAWATWADAMVEQRVRQATVSKESEAFNTIADRIEGRAPQRVELETADNREIRLKVEFDAPAERKK